MNSYELRLNTLKKIADEICDDNLREEIKTFSVKWLETYNQISK